MPIIAFLTLLLIPLASAAQVYKCTDENGRIEYRQTPCTEGPGGGRRQPDSTLQIPAAPADSVPNGSAGLRPGERALLDQLDHEQAVRERQERLNRAARRGHVRPGMTPTMVRRAWGEPNRINRTVTSDTTSEQWVYDCGAGCGRYVYLRDGVVTSFQD